MNSPENYNFDREINSLELELASTAMHNQIKELLQVNNPIRKRHPVQGFLNLLTYSAATLGEPGNLPFLNSWSSTNWVSLNEENPEEQRHITLTGIGGKRLEDAHETRVQVEGVSGILMLNESGGKIIEPNIKGKYYLSNSRNLTLEDVRFFQAALNKLPNPQEPPEKI